MPHVVGNVYFDEEGRPMPLDVAIAKGLANVAAPPQALPFAGIVPPAAPLDTGPRVGVTGGGEGAAADTLEGVARVPEITPTSAASSLPPAAARYLSAPPPAPPVLAPPVQPVQPATKEPSFQERAAASVGRVIGQAGKSRTSQVGLGLTAPSVAAATSPTQLQVIEDQTRLGQQAATLEGQVATEEQRYRDVVAQTTARQAEDRQRLSTAIADRQGRRRAQVERDYAIDPNRYFKQQSTAQKIFTILGLAIGGFMEPVTGKNSAREIVEGMIARDMEAQRTDLQRALAILEREEAADERSMSEQERVDAATRQALADKYASVIAGLKTEMAKVKGQEAQTRGTQLLGALEERLGAILTESNIRGTEVVIRSRELALQEAQAARARAELSRREAAAAQVPQVRTDTDLAARLGYNEKQAERLVIVRPEDPTAPNEGHFLAQDTGQAKEARSFIEAARTVGALIGEIQYLIEQPGALSATGEFDRTRSEVARHIAANQAQIQLHMTKFVAGNPSDYENKLVEQAMGGKLTKWKRGDFLAFQRVLDKVYANVRLGAQEKLNASQYVGGQFDPKANFTFGKPDVGIAQQAQDAVARAGFGVDREERLLGWRDLLDMSGYGAMTAEGKVKRLPETIIDLQNGRNVAATSNSIKRNMDFLRELARTTKDPTAQKIATQGIAQLGALKKQMEKAESSGADEGLGNAPRGKYPKIFWSIPFNPRGIVTDEPVFPDEE